MEGDAIDRELDRLDQINDWGCPCGMGPHTWTGAVQVRVRDAVFGRLEHFSLRHAVWGMCDCKDGAPHLHAAREFVAAGLAIPR